jgi:hypothetical protein
MKLSRLQKAFLKRAANEPGIPQRKLYRANLKNRSEYFLWSELQKLSQMGLLLLEKQPNGRVLVYPVEVPA